MLFRNQLGSSAKDQAHEQSNKSLQTHGGAAGFYDKPEARTLFMLAGPDCTRLIEEFEAVNDPPLSSTAHHEEGHSLQLKFQNDVLSFIKVVKQLGNPFLATSQELIALDTQTVMEQAVATSLSKIREAGQTLHAAYVMERLEKASVPVSDTIK